MKITGEFKDLFDNIIRVEIDNTSVSSDDIVIGDEFNGYDDSAEIYFSDEPIELESEVDSLFDITIMQSAEINILTKNFIGDKLFADNDRSATVKIWKNNKIIFDGYVEAGTFDQKFTNPYDEYTINAVDKLSTLQYHKYKDVKPSTFDELLPTLGNVTFKALIDNCLGEIVCDGAIYYDMSKGITESRRNLVFNDLMVSEQEIVGNDYDGVWSDQDTLEEMLRYLNLHIRQIGSDFYIFDWESIRNRNTQWVNLIDNELYEINPKVITLSADMNAGNDTSISIDEVYNQISVTCELNGQDQLFESPLDSESLLSEYSNRQKYLTEYISEGEGRSAINAFKAMIKGENTNYGACKKVDWYLQWLYNKNWKLYSCQGNVDELVEKDPNGTAINQWNVSERLIHNQIEPAIVSLGKVTYEAGRITDDSKITKISMSNYLVISTNGNGNDEEASPTQNQIDKRKPVLEYLGANSGGVYSPTDDKTTNYLVFSGKVCFVPLQSQTDLWSNLYRVAFEPDSGHYEYPLLWWTDEDGTLYPVWETDSDGNYILDANGNKIQARDYNAEDPQFVIDTGYFTTQYWHHTVPSDNNGDGRYYTRKWYKTKYVTDNPSTALFSDYGLHPLTDDKSNHLYEYNYSTVGDDNDLISNLDVLECELIIGDKRLIQMDGNDKSSLMWVKLGEEPSIVGDDAQPHKITSFKLSINPKIGDKIIGGEFNIASNLDFTANIDSDGFAIPIKKSDGLTGQVLFRILGPVNTSWNQVNKSTHRKWIFWKCTHWSSNIHYLLAHSESIMIKDFKCEMKSDNAGINVDFKDYDKDLIYVSNETDKYINRYDETTFKFITQPTTDECIQIGCQTGSNYNAVTDARTGLPISTIYNNVTLDSYKAEQHYVNQYYLDYNTPKILLKTEVWDANDIDYFNIYKYTPLNRDFYIKSMVKTLHNNKVNITLREK